MARNVIGILSVSLLAVLTAHAASPPNLETALAAQHQLAASRPYDAAVHNDLGNLLVLDRRYDEAEQSYRRAIELAPASASARFNLGVLLQQLGRARDAMAELRGVLEIDDRHARTYYQMGMLLEARKQRSAAIEHYARAFALDPELTFARVNPHIIDNALATEAILVSRRYLEEPSSTMPRLYGEPERIAGLMLGPPEGEAPPAASPAAEAPSAEAQAATPPAEAPSAEAPASAEAPVASAAPSAEDAAVAPATVPVPAEEDGEESEDAGSEDEGRRVLTPQHLQTGSGVGQVQRPGSAARRRVPPASTPSTGADGRTRVVRPGSDPQRPSTSVGRTPDNRPRYRPPSRLSTGRLELQLLPPEEEPVTRAAR